jgi:arabinan endo-1,5-alpha-L-arabinosidase
MNNMISPCSAKSKNAFRDFNRNLKLYPLLRHSLFVFFCATVAVSTASAALWNLTGAVVTHDPSIIKEGSTWWVFETGVGLPVKFSSNGTAWKQGARLFNSTPSWWNTYVPNNVRDSKVWAPDIRKFGNRTYCYYSISVFGKNTSAIGLSSCSSIAAGDWRDDGVVISSKAGVNAYNAIDPNLTVDASGNPWLVFGSWFDGIHIVRLNTSTMKPTGTIFSIAKRSGGIEGASLVYVNGFYYLFVSIDVCCNGVNSTYKIAYGRSTNITGPYVDKNGAAMSSGNCTIMDAGNARWKGPGGQSVYQNGSAWVIVRHSYDANNNGTPTMLINDLFWDSSKWPTY